MNATLPRRRSLAVVSLVAILLAVRPAEAQEDGIVGLRFGRADASHTVLATNLPIASRRIILCSDREGARHSRSWLAALDSLAPGHERVEAAHLAGVPAVAAPFVRRAFRRSPHILLDWDGVLARQYGFAEGLVNVYVIDGRGRLLLWVRGTDPDAALGEVRDQLAAVLPAAAGDEP